LYAQGNAAPGIARESAIADEKGIVQGSRHTHVVTTALMIIVKCGIPDIDT
jgi:hypothetical protein